MFFVDQQNPLQRPGQSPEVEFASHRIHFVRTMARAVAGANNAKRPQPLVGI